MTFLQPGRRITALSAPSTVRSRRPPLSADGRGRGLPSVSATRRCRRSKRVAEIAENAGIDGNEVLEGQPRDWQIASGNCGNSLQILCPRNCPQFHRLTLGSSPDAGPQCDTQPPADVSTP